MSRNDKKKEKLLLRVGGSDSYMDIPTHSAPALVGDEDEATAASTEALQEASLRRR